MNKKAEWESETYVISSLAIHSFVIKIFIQHIQNVLLIILGEATRPFSLGCSCHSLFKLSINLCTHACWWTTKNFSNGKRLVHYFMGILKIHSLYFKSPWNFHFVYFLIFLHINVPDSSFICWFLVPTRFCIGFCTFQAFSLYHCLLILFSKKLCNEQRRRRYFILYL